MAGSIEVEVGEVKVGLLWGAVARGGHVDGAKRGGILEGR